jgi:hypothetical protein
LGEEDERSARDFTAFLQHLILLENSVLSKTVLYLLTHCFPLVLSKVSFARFVHRYLMLKSIDGGILKSFSERFFFTLCPYYDIIAYL